MTPAARRGVIDFFRDRYGFSERRACRMIDADRSTYRRRSSRLRRDRALAERLEQLAVERPRFGYRRLHVLLCREGWAVNRKRVYRIYRQLGLAVRRKRRKRVAEANRLPRVVPMAADLQWSMDFMRDTLSSGRVFRTLNVVDDATRECLAIEVDTSISGFRVGRVLDRIATRRGRYPTRLVLDNGPECTSRALDQWAYERGVELAFIRPGKPMENCFVESFNGSFRDECLNAHWFLTLGDARRTIEAWRLDYNRVRPHSSLGYLPPSVYAEGAGLRPTASAPPAPTQPRALNGR